jgi:hypothetical protein
MSQCYGNETLSTKVDSDMRQFIEDGSAELGVSSAEFVRRVLDLYRRGALGDVDCPACEATLDLSAGVK